MFRRGWLALLLLFASSRALGQGGPPFITDDPGTPGSGHWENIVASTLERNRAQSLFEAPLLDFNYGLGDRVQLKYEVPFLVLDEQGDGPVGGIGDSLVGVKWRFLDGRKYCVAMSVYPQLEFNNPTNSGERGLVESRTDFLVPLEAGTTFGKLEVAVELGYGFVQHAADKWVYGVVAAYPLANKIECGAEIHGEVDQDFHNNLPVFNVGTRWEMSNHLTLLASVGRSFRSAPEDAPTLLAYLGLQFNF